MNARLVPLSVSPIQLARPGSSVHELILQYSGSRALSVSLHPGRGHGLACSLLGRQSSERLSVAFALSGKVAYGNVLVPVPAEL